MCNAGKPYYEALPKALKPHHYDLSVSVIDVDNGTFEGVVKIYLAIDGATDELHLNYRDLKINQDGISIQVADGTSGSQWQDVKVASVVESPAKEFFVVKLAQKVEPRQAQLTATLRYTGVIQNNMAGFYKSTYTEAGKEKCMLSTQFEATDARRAFPCLDEPELKATFTVDITLRSDWVALGNMPVAHEEAQAGNLKKVVFAKTPIMSTYLLAWACGDFEYIESFTEDVYTDSKPLPVRIYTTKGYKAEAQFALEIAPKIVDYFSKIFEIKYPLPKLDLIAVHAYSHNAMENWGLITYRLSALLYSESKSDPSYKQKVCYVVAHEIAHQWFGNLVTMKWWDELWLNEGFATWVGFAAVDFLFPEWDIFSGFVSELLQNALNLDGLRNSHPIEVPVVSALDIDQVFDAILYLKGASTILMLSKYLGQNLFLKGVARYLNKNKFSNATSHDLFSSIEQVSGQPIDRLMQSWIQKIGFPILNVTAEEEGVGVSQSRFLNGGDIQKDEDQTIWWIPLNVSTGKGKDDVNRVLKSLMTKSELIKSLPLDSFFKFNKDTSGVFRVNYSPEILQTNILPYFDRLLATDKVGLIADVASVAVSGINDQTRTLVLLQLIKSLVDANELGNSYVVWLELGNRLGNVLTTFSQVDPELTEKLLRFARFVYSAKTKELISTADTKGDFLLSKLKAEILERAGILGIPEAQQLAVQLFDQWKTKHTIDPALRRFVFSTVVSTPSLINELSYGLIMQEVVVPTSLDSREVTLSALGHVNNDKIFQSLISKLTEPEVIPIMDAHFLGKSLSTNVHTRDAFWTYFKANYDAIYKLMATNMVVLDRFVKLTLGNYQSTAMYHEIRDFFQDKDVHGFERSIRQVLDNVKIRAAWLDRDLHNVKQWLTDNGF